MKTTLNNFIISATYKGNKAATWYPQNSNNYVVSVKDTETGKSTRFDFWASLAHPEIEKEEEIINAFACFVGDAMSGGLTFPDFCSSFGYDEDSRNAYKLWKACERAYKKWERFTNADIYDVWETING